MQQIGVDANGLQGIQGLCILWFIVCRCNSLVLWDHRLSTVLLALHVAGGCLLCVVQLVLTWMVLGCQTVLGDKPF